MTEQYETQKVFFAHPVKEGFKAVSYDPNGKAVSAGNFIPEAYKAFCRYADKQGYLVFDLPVEVPAIITPEITDFLSAYAGILAGKGEYIDNKIEGGERAWL